MSVGYIIAPRLVSTTGQIMQGDVFRDIPLEHLLPRVEEPTNYVGALLLTPTCDFALKGGHPEREVIPINAHLPGESQQDTVVPLYLLQLPALAELFPHGALLHFRRAVIVPAGTLEPTKRVATLNAQGLRVLLAAHTTYYTRSTIDPAGIAFPADDPRLLWEAIDRARSVASLARMRDELEQATALATRALLYHHGLKTGSAAQSLVLLEQCAQHEVFPRSSTNATRLLTEGQSTLRALYAVAPAELAGWRKQLNELFTGLEGIALVLQEPQPVRITAALLREHGLGNILPR